MRILPQVNDRDLCLLNCVTNFINDLNTSVNYIRDKYFTIKITTIISLSGTMSNFHRHSVSYHVWDQSHQQGIMGNYLTRTVSLLHCAVQLKCCMNWVNIIFVCRPFEERACHWSLIFGWMKTGKACNSRKIIVPNFFGQKSPLMWSISEILWFWYVLYPSVLLMLLYFFAKLALLNLVSTCTFIS